MVRAQRLAAGAARGAVAVLAAMVLLACPRPAAPGAETAAVPAGAAAPTAPAGKIEHLKVRVVATHPHDATSYTQGLLYAGGELYESAGLYGPSSLRRVDPATGAVRQKVDVPAAYFAEGLALVGEKLIQLTWKEGVALVYDRKSFARTGQLAYTGEGWGLCWDGRRLVMSDGSDRLTIRDPGSFQATGEIKVTRDGVPVEQLNELECVGDAIYANIWQSDEIVRIDAATGHVTAAIDASGLLTAGERAKADVLNGIAWNPATRRFAITGKLWPRLFEVEFVP